MLSESLAGQSTSCGQRKRIRLNSLHLFLIFRCADISRFLRWNQRNDLTSEIGIVKLTDLVPTQRLGHSLSC